MGIDSHIVRGLILLKKCSGPLIKGQKYLSEVPFCTTFNLYIVLYFPKNITKIINWHFIEIQRPKFCLFAAFFISLKKVQMLFMSGIHELGQIMEE